MGRNKTPKVPDNRKGMLKNDTPEEKRLKEGEVYITYSLVKTLMPQDIEDDDILLANVMLDDEFLLSKIVVCKGRGIERSIRNKTDFKFLHIHVEVLGFHGKANID